MTGFFHRETPQITVEKPRSQGRVAPHDLPSSGGVLSCLRSSRSTAGEPRNAAHCAHWYCEWHVPSMAPSPFSRKMPSRASQHCWSVKETLVRFTSCASGPVSELTLCPTLGRRFVVVTNAWGPPSSFFSARVSVVSRCSAAHRLEKSESQSTTHPRARA